MTCTPPYARGSTGTPSCFCCKCCPPSSCPHVRWKYTLTSISSSGMGFQFEEDEFFLSFEESKFSSDSTESNSTLK